MVKSELNAALVIAKSDQSLLDVDHSPLFGLYLATFERVETTINVVARLLREQCVMLNGEIDTVELAQFADAARRKIVVIG